MIKEEKILQDLIELDRQEFDETGLVNGELCKHEDIEQDDLGNSYCLICGIEQEPDWDLIARYGGEEGVIENARD